MTRMSSEIDDAWSQEEFKLRFPDVDPGVKPYANRVILQIRSPTKRTKGGILLPDDIEETELFLTQTGLVRALGPVAFRDRSTLAVWPEGEWCQPGTLVRFPKYNQDKWWVEYDTGKTLDNGKIVFNRALFMMIGDKDILGERTGNPFAISGYVR